MKSLWNLLKFTLLFCHFSTNSLSSLNSLYFSRIHFELTILFPKSLWMYYFPRNQFEFNLLFCETICWIHNLLREFTMNSHLLWDFSINSSSFSLIHFESTIFLQNHYDRYKITMKSIWNGYEITMNSKSSWWFHLESILFFANSLWIHYLLTLLLWIHYLLRDFIMNSLSISRPWWI